jgi:hypothetical protein
MTQHVVSLYWSLIAAVLLLALAGLALQAHGIQSILGRW